MNKTNSASQTSVPPTSSSYWVVPKLLLAGAYPGDPDPDEHHLKVQSLVGAGKRAAQIQVIAKAKPAGAEN